MGQGHKILNYFVVIIVDGGAFEASEADFTTLASGPYYV
jgi:hypothetical protein